jgi:hypothetical protein
MGIKSRPLLYLRAGSVRHTEESGFGLLPTPTAMQDEADPAKVDARNEKQIAMGNPKFILGLTQMAKRGMLPTPATRDYKGTNSLEHLRGQNGNKMTHENQLPNYIKLMTGSNSQLNPQFVAEMMGFPANWTELPFPSGEQKV